MPTSAPLLRIAARATVVGALSLTWVAGWAQWQWIDGSGRKVFSDTAPPASVPEKNILKRPGLVVSPVAAPAEPAQAAANSPAAAAPAAPQAPTVDKELEAKKKQAEAEEEAKKKAEAERIARLRADNCARARQAKTTIDSGARMATTNAKGEREFIDDKARAAESQRLAAIIRSDC
ncbi:MAG: DUF4124 domain-containing protein [Hydrogenophaga sp.]|uniref:DUF4124 domain-containing protein n=1 Tax=Hydrogenophaga sp. TaxID=1904254 RepID=UPI001D2032DC|nr:DUF4124 domain-containing protein [Hydrogenophaga sp.]MBX3611367.1 DUF4124 domain-containing protein [Hydrogenophaga sp.]